MKRVILTMSILAGFVIIPACATFFGPSSNNVVLNPTNTTLITEIAAQNLQGIIGNTAFQSVVFSPCTSQAGYQLPTDLVYSMTISGSPDWMTFTPATRTLGLNGVTVVPNVALINSLISCIYTCTSTSASQQTATININCNDIDSDGGADNLELTNSVPPLCTNSGYFRITPSETQYYRAGTSSANYKIPNCITVAGVLSPTVSNITTDIDGDGLFDIDELVTLGTNPYVAAMGADFGAATNYAALRQTRYIATADIDNDGNLDLLATDSGIGDGSGNSFSLFYGNGDGTFNAANAVPTSGSVPMGIAVADFNADGLVDVAVVNNSSHTFAILLNGGGGEANPFGDPVVYNIGIANFPEGIVAFDVDNDTDVDLFIINPNGGDDNGIGALAYNDGEGSFSIAAFPYTLGRDPSMVVTADFDNDGFLDLAVSNRSSSNITILHNDGNGSFDIITNYAIDTDGGGTPFGIGAADFNGDTYMDIVVSDTTRSTIIPFLNDGDGTFTRQTAIDVTTDGSAISGLVVADFNGDNNADVIVARSTTNSISVMLGNGTGSFSEFTQIDGSTGATPWNLTVGDFDGNAALDIATANTGGNNISVKLNE